MTDDKRHESERSPQSVRLTLEIGRPWLVTMWALFIFLTGAITGAAVMQLWRPHPPRGERQASPLPRDFARRLQRDLDLSTEQTQEVEEVVLKYEPLFRRTSEDAREQLRLDLEAMNQEILPLLNEEQRERHEEVWRRILRPPPHRQRPRKPPRDEHPPRHDHRR